MCGTSHPAEHTRHIGLMVGVGRRRLRMYISMRLRARVPKACSMQTQARAFSSACRARNVQRPSSQIALSPARAKARRGASRAPTAR
eukprot:2118607-Pleurochrysis_carterae.AAC.1